MSKRPFKAQASSSRAALGVGFGGFGASSTSSTLSYLTEPSDLSSISDAHVIVGFKNLSKKDGTTKAKALEDLRAYTQAHPFEQGGGPEEAILEAWVKFYPRLSIDNSRRVRELSHNLQYELLKAARKRMEKHIPKIVGSWLAGTFDRDRAVARAATDGIESFLDTGDKVALFWKRCQVQILAYAQEAINETPETLSDERTMRPDDVQAKYFRVVGSSISLVLSLLVKLSRDDVLKQQDKYEEFLAGNEKLWAFAACEDPFVRRTTDQLLFVCLDRQYEIIEQDLELVSRALIVKALRSSQSSSAFQLLQSLAKLTSKFPHAWTSAYKGRQSALSSLRSFIEKGSQGGPAEYWQFLQSLLSLLPSGVLPTDIDASLEFLKAFRDGISHREEPRINAAEGWSSYFEVARILVENLPNSTLQGKLFQESIYPVFEQYLHPTTENSRWSVGNNTVALAKAYSVCVSAKDPGLQQSFSDEWNRLANDFVSRILTSLPEQSKDYQKSQDAVASEGHRWFGLLSNVLQKDKPNESDRLLILPSSLIIDAALQAIVTRNGKPYSAASTVEVALRLSPVLMEVSPTPLGAIRSFLEKSLPRLILSPSSPYLVSILNLIRSIPDQEAIFEDIWQSTIDGLLPLPEDSGKLKAITSLISNDAVANLSQADADLQDFLLEASMKAVNVNSEAWPLFEAAITFNALTEPAGGELVDEVLKHLEANDANVDGAFKALEFISRKKPDLLRRQSNTHVVLITKLLAIMELSSSEFASRAEGLRAVIENSNGTADQQDLNETPILHVIRENLEIASPQSLSIDTLVQQAKSVLEETDEPDKAQALFPDLAQWFATLHPLLEHPPNPAMAVMRPFAGTVFIARPSYNERFPRHTRDINGYSVPLRMAMYVTGLSAERNFALLAHEEQAEILYLLSITSELANDQLDLLEDNKLFESHSDPQALSEVRDFLSKSRVCFDPIICNARDWRDDIKQGQSDPADARSSAVVRSLISKFLTSSSSSTMTGLYAAKALGRLLPKLVDAHGWQSVGSEEWLSKLEILKPSTPNILGATAVLIGLQDILGTSKIVNNLCNRLISDVAGASAKSEKTLGLVILLNACIGVYDEGDLPVAQNRLIFAVKQILSWADTLATSDRQLSSEVCRALQTLLPAIKEVYGTYWESALNFCISIWESREGVLSTSSPTLPSTGLSNLTLPMIGMSLKLFTILRNLNDTNEDLTDALAELSEPVSQSLIKLLKLPRSKESQPLEYVDDLLSRQVVKIPLGHIKDLTEFYPLVASDFRTIQSAAFDVLHKALPEAQQQISVDVLLEKRDARLPEELLSLLLDAPSLNSFPDEILTEFPTSIRGYLLSWHLVYDSFNNASYKVRNDYSEILKSENYIGPLLDFIFDVLGHSAAKAINVDKARFDASMIRSYNMWEANDSESNDRNMQWLLINLYYLCLKYTPNLVKNWWVDCKSKQTRIAVESWTERFFSPLVIADTLDEVSGWAEEQESASEDEKELIVKVSKRSREVIAGYEVDDMMMQIVIRLPANYPLEGVKVEGISRVAVSEKKWTSWLMITQGVITFSNGSITDGLTTFRRNVTGALKGQTECAICYSIISSDRKMPDKRCQTCRNLFHASCLFKWFASSNQSTCPLCRNPFNYGMERGRRAGGGGGGGGN